MIPEENTIPEESIQEDNLSTKENTQQESVVMESVELSLDVNEKQTIKLDDYLSPI